MGKIRYLFKICESCKGTGKQLSPPEHAGEPDCGVCDGQGKLLWGYVQDDEED